MQPTSSVSWQQSRGERRRFPRYSLQVPLNVVALRSGIPSTIPGRTLDLGEGGIAAVLAGELRVGESVGIDLKLPFTLEPIQAKALVRHHGPSRCGLQFLSMPPEQYGSLRTWTAITASGNQVRTETAPPGESTRNRREPRGMARQASAPMRRSLRGPRHWLLALLVLALVVGALAWWSGLNGRYPFQRNLEAGETTSEGRVKVPSPTMQRNLLHRVEPVYPPQALASKLQGVVLLDTIIGQDGVVKQVHLLSGPDMLARPAMEAVKWWRFQPYQVDGVPREVETTIEVDFRLNQ